MCVHWANERHGNGLWAAGYLTDSRDRALYIIGPYPIAPDSEGNRDLVDRYWAAVGGRPRESMENVWVEVGPGRLPEPRQRARQRF